MSVDILILASVLRASKHGYEIRQKVERLLGGSVHLNNNQLYPELRKLEARGSLQRETQSQRGRPDRHVYSLTAEGLRQLKAMLAHFPDSLARDEKAFLVRVTHFDLVDEDDRRRILEARLRALREKLAELAERRPLVPEERVYAFKVIDFAEQRIRLEFEWIHQL